MIIVHVFSGIDHNGGLPEEVRYLIQSQIKLRNEVYIISEHKKYFNNHRLDGIKKLILLKGSIIKKYKVLRELINEIRPNYFHLYGGWDFFNVICWYAIKNARCPYIVTLHGNLNPFIYKRRFGEKKNWIFYELLKRGYQYLFDLRIFKNAIALHCLSEYEREMGEKNKFKSKYIVLPFGIKNFYYSTSKLSSADGKKIIFIGRLDIFQKGLDILIDAVKIINDKYHIHRFTIDLFGPDINNSQNILKERIREYKISNINLRGKIPNDTVLNILCNYDYFILPSRYEGLAKVVREAIMVGLPVIASRESNFGDWVLKYNMGFCIQELTPEGVGIALEKAINIDEFTYNKLRENTAKWANDYTWEKVALILNNEMEQIINV